MDFSNVPVAYMRTRRTGDDEYDTVLTIVHPGYVSEDGDILLYATPPKVEHSQAVDDVIAERRRQIEVEKWTPDHDDEWNMRRELASAAACYALAASMSEYGRHLNHEDGNRGLLRKWTPVEGSTLLARLWPWDWRWWKPTTRRADLVKAAALAIAEIERLDRAGEV